MSDLNEIEFSFRDEQPATAAMRKNYSPNEMDRVTRGHNVARRSLTRDVIARVQAIDNEDVPATGKGLTTEMPLRAGEESLGVDLLRESHAAEMREVREGDHLDETGRYIFRNVPIVKNYALPLGFFIRQGDGLIKKFGIFVSRVTKGSIVDANGLLKIGDEIVAVNRVDVEGFSLDDVVRLIQIPRKLILTIRTSAFVFKRSSSVGDAYGSPSTYNKRMDKATSKGYKSKNKASRASDYQEPSNHCKQTMQTETEISKVDKNANEFLDLSRSSVRSEGSSTIEDLINAIRAQNSRAKHSRRSLEQVGSFPLDHSQLSDQMGEESCREALPRKPSADSIIFSKRTPRSSTQKSSTLTPVTTVNLIFDDPEDFTVNSTPSSGQITRKISMPDTLKVSSTMLNARSPPGSPGNSPKMRRRLPLVPSDSGRSSRSGSERSVESFNESSSPTTTQALLILPAEPRSRRMLPTPPPSSVVDHEDSPNVNKRKASSSSEPRDSRKLNRNSWSGPSDSESVDDKSPAPSSSRRESGLSLSQLFSAFAFRNHSDVSEASEQNKDSQGDKIPSTPQRPARKSEQQPDDIFEQQRHSMLLHSYASGSLQPPSNPRRLISRSSQPNLLAVQEEQSKPLGNLSAATMPTYYENAKFSPKLNWRRASVASITDKSLANQLASQELIDSDQLRSEAEAGFLIFPDDYGGHNLLSSHAVSGMVSLHIIKATNLLFADKKLLEKKKKVFCAVEVDFERKAFSSSKRASKTVTWDEMFEVEIQHGRKVCLSCFTSSHEFDKPVAKVTFNLSPFVRCGQRHKVLLRMNPQGAIHLEMGFIEMKTLLKRAPSDRKSGVFGFQLNVTSQNENASVPLVVRKCVEEIEKRGLTAKGLYRISGNARRKKQLHAQFDEDSTAVDLSEESYPDINVIAGILKDYLRELPEPLITESLSKLLVKAAQEQVQDQEQSLQKRFLSKLLVQLPQNNRETLVYLLNHFMRVIAEKDTNKMDAHNLSVCFGPVLLCPPANLTESKDLLDLKLHIKIVEFLFYLWKNAGMTSV